MTPTPPPLYRQFWRSRIGKRLVHALEPSRWWVVIFIVGLIAVLVWTLTIYRNQTADEAARKAEIVATADARYAACVTSIPFLTKINKKFASDDLTDAVTLANSYRLLLATPSGSRIKTARRKNFTRLKQAQAEAYAIVLPVPTIKKNAKEPTGQSCEEIRAALLERKA